MNVGNSEEQLLRLTTGIVAAHVSHNRLPPDNLPGLIRLVYAALSTVGTTTPLADVQPQPAVPIKKSVLTDHIVCLEDGMKLKVLKRHLRTKYGMTPSQYRQRWGLPDNYPMVAPSYSAHRSSLAKKIGLGSKPSKPAVTEVVVQQVSEGVKGRRPGRKALAPV